LAAIIGDLSRPLKHVQRAKDCPLLGRSIAGAGCGPALRGQSPGGVALATALRRGRVERLLREGSRKPGKPPTPLPAIAKGALGSQAAVQHPERPLAFLDAQYAEPAWGRQKPT
jgi:hypothetical protein